MLFLSLHLLLVLLCFLLENYDLTLKLDSLLFFIRKHLRQSLLKEFDVFLKRLGLGILFDLGQLLIFIFNNLSIHDILELLN
jgi:hypothetical protein